MHYTNILQHLSNRTSIHLQGDTDGLIINVYQGLLNYLTKIKLNIYVYFHVDT